MKLMATIRNFFNGPKIDPAALAALDAFISATDAYGVALEATMAYSLRANHRYLISEAKDVLNDAPRDDPCAAREYEEAVSSFTDSADFAPYTEAELDAHTSAIDTLTSAFDNVTAIFAAFSPNDNARGASAALYEATCHTFTISATAYSQGAGRALTDALNEQLQAAADRLRSCKLDYECTRPHVTTAVKIMAADYEARVAKHAAKTAALEQLKQRASVAKTKAEVFLAKAEAAQAKAEEALETAQ